MGAEGTLIRVNIRVSLIAVMKLGNGGLKDLRCVGNERYGCLCWRGCLSKNVACLNGGVIL